MENQNVKDTKSDQNETPSGDLKPIEKVSSGQRLAQEPLYYADYLKLDELLNLQKPESEKKGAPAHDEMLFIIIHQVYELWFKQILHEVSAVIKMMNKPYVPERDMSRVVHHLQRVTVIQKVLVDQLNILETMTPLDFMEFRDFLFPASGFQSFQFRLVENLMGLESDKRVQYERQAYHTRLSPAHQKLVTEAESSMSLFKVVEQWLERTPFLKYGNFDFLEQYQAAAERMFQEDIDIVMKNTEPDSPEREKELKVIEGNRQHFRALFNEKEYNELRERGSKRLSYKATQAALLISIYQEEPIFHLPYTLLNTLMDIDEFFATWRYKHALMVSRMIGTKLGTGGSSGYWYLKSTVERGRVFSDISNLSTYLLPRKEAPPLPEEVRKAMDFKIKNDSK